MDCVTVVLLGEPVAWARARLGQRGIPFTPKRQRNNAVALKLLAQQEMIGRIPFTGPVRLHLTAEFPIPQGFSRAKRQAAIDRQLRPTRRPDLSNIVKQVEDALNGVVFYDDSLIVEYGVLQKIYSTQPKITATVYALPAWVPPVRLSKAVLEDAAVGPGLLV